MKPGSVGGNEGDPFVAVVSIFGERVGFDHGGVDVPGPLEGQPSEDATADPGPQFCGSRSTNPVQDPHRGEDAPDFPRHEQPDRLRVHDGPCERVSLGKGALRDIEDGQIEIGQAEQDHDEQGEVHSSMTASEPSGVFGPDTNL